MRLNTLLTGVAAATLAMLAAASAHAETAAAAAPEAPVATAPAAEGAPYQPPTTRELTMRDMQDRIEALQAQLDQMKQMLAAQSGSVAAPAAKPPASAPAQATLANGRPGWTSADGKFSAALNGVMQFDAANYYQDHDLPAQITGAARDLNGGTNARRARLGFAGKAFGDWDYNFLYEFGGSGQEDAAHIQELWLQYTGFLKPFHLRVGYQLPSANMDDAASTNTMLFLERSAPDDVARSQAAGDFRSAVTLWGNSDFKTHFADGSKLGWFLSGAVTGNTASTVNSTGAFAVSPFDEQLGLVGRAAINYRMADDSIVLHAGVNGQDVIHPQDNTGIGSAIAGRYTLQLRERPELRVDGTRLVDTGALNAAHETVLGAELAGMYKQFYVQTEYFDYKVDGDHATPTTPSPDFKGWYVMGSWILTGEHRNYATTSAAFNGPTVAHPFDWRSNTWGAFELGVRYSDLDLNDNAGVAGAATPVGGVRGGEQKITSAVFTWYPNQVVRFMLQGQHVDIDRLNAAGLSLGQSFNTIALRSQLAW